MDLTNIIDDMEYYSVNIEYIRMDVKRQFITKFKIKKQENIDIITNIIERRINVHNCPNYSWRGYYTFGIDKKLLYSVKVEYNALKVLSKYLKPRLIHHLYKYPNGMRFITLKEKYNNYNLSNIQLKN